MSITRTTNEQRKNLVKSILKQAVDHYHHLIGLGRWSEGYVERVDPASGLNRHGSIQRVKSVADILATLLKRSVRHESYRIIVVQAGRHSYNAHLITEPCAISGDYHETRRRMTFRGIPSNLAPLMHGVNVYRDNGTQYRGTLVIPPTLRSSYHSYTSPRGNLCWRYGVTTGDFDHPNMSPSLRSVPVQVEMLPPVEGEFVSTLAIYTSVLPHVQSNLEYLR